MTTSAVAPPHPIATPHHLAVMQEVFPASFLREPWEMAPADNILLRLPEKSLPRFRQVLRLVRLVLVIVALGKLAAIFAPGLHFVLLMGDLVVGSTGFVVALLLLTWAHARDLRDRFQLDQLLTIPEGPRQLAQAVFLRPFGEIVRLLLNYYVFSFAAFGFNLIVLLATVGAQPDTVAMFGLLFVVLCFQSPWILTIYPLLLQTASRGIRDAFLPERNYLTSLFIILPGTAVIFGLYNFAVVLILVTLFAGMNDGALALLLFSAFFFFTLSLPLLLMLKSITGWGTRQLRALHDELLIAWMG
jgi:hypothetical protein